MARINTLSSIGWIHFSRDALRRAEALLKAEQEGVRDEIGFLLLHQAYADRFFPGTSVLQTRMRYVFFVPWLYNDLMKSFRGGDFEREIVRKEIELTKRLMHNKEGVIGSKSYPDPTSQPASMVYWTALGTWGLLKPLTEGHLPPRSRIHRLLSTRRTITDLIDDDKEPLEDRWRIFVKMPEPPAIWKKPDAKLSFRLQKEEKDFLIKHLVAVTQGRGNGELSLLARLVEKRVPVAPLDVPWKKPIMDIASANDREALVSAMRIAALSAIGRGIYASLAETALERDGLETDRIHRNALNKLIDEYRTEALKLDTRGILNDCPELKGKKIIEILEATKAWLARGCKKPADLQKCYEEAEITRKGPVRAKLPNTPFARERRREWSLNKGKISEPIHYRWKNVRRLLMDLQGET